MKRKSMLACGMAAVVLTFVGANAISAQDKYALRVPDGLAFDEFRGYEDWKVIGVSHQAKLKLIEVIVGNPAMIDAYQAGIPGNGKPFPDGAKMAKIHWNAVQNPQEPGDPFVPGSLHDVDFMVRDSKRFAETGGWGYAEFDYEAASDTFKPLKSGSACGFACHTLAKSKDYVFTAYGKR